MKEFFKQIYSSSLAKNSGIYILAIFLEKSIPFLLLPILTRYLTTADYGIVSMFSVLVGLSMPIVSIGMKPAILRSYYKDDINFTTYINSALSLLLISTAFLLIIAYIFADFITSITEFPQNWLFTVIFVAVGQFIVGILLVIWQAEYKALQFGTFNILVTSINIGLSVYLIVALGYGWDGRVIGKLFAYVLFSLIALQILYQKQLISFSISFQYIKHLLLFGVPLIPHLLSNFVISMSDRIFITNMVGIDETGIYTVGYQIGMIISVLAYSFNKAWHPWLFEKLKNGKQEIKIKIVKITYGYFLLIIVLAFVLSLIAPWFINIFIGEAFTGSVQYVFWIALGYAFQGMTYMVINYIYFEEKTHLLTWLTILSAGLNIVLNYILIKKYGAIGAAQATTVTFLIQFLLTWIVSSRTHNMPWLLRT